MSVMSIFTALPCFLWVTVYWWCEFVYLSLFLFLSFPIRPKFSYGTVDGVWRERAESRRNLLGSENRDPLRTSSTSGPQKISGLSSSTDPDSYSKILMPLLLMDWTNPAEHLKVFERLGRFDRSAMDLVSVVAYMRLAAWHDEWRLHWNS